MQELMNRGIAACRNEQFEEGVKCFSKVLSNEPSNAVALYHRARALAKLGDMLKSLSDFKRLTQLEPNNADYLGDYGVSLHLNKRHKDAHEIFQKAIALDPNNPYRYSSLAFFLDRIGKPEEAIAAYEKAIALDPADAIALNNKGLIEEKLGRKAAAKKSFDQSNDLIGYEPEIKNESTHEPSSELETRFNNRSDVIKSLLTKDGFNDFIQFYKDKLKKKED